MVVIMSLKRSCSELLWAAMAVEALTSSLCRYYSGCMWKMVCKDLHIKAEASIWGLGRQFCDSRAYLAGPWHSLHTWVSTMELFPHLVDSLELPAQWRSCEKQECFSRLAICFCRALQQGNIIWIGEDSNETAPSIPIFSFKLLLKLSWNITEAILKRTALPGVGQLPVPFWSMKVVSASHVRI